MVTTVGVRLRLTAGAAALAVAVAGFAAPAPAAATAAVTPSPTGVSGTPGDGSISVGWMPITGTGAVSYRVWATTEADGAYPGDATCAEPVEENPCVIADLVNGTEYHVYVAAADDNGESVPAAPDGDQPVVPESTLTPPSDVTAEPGD